MPARLGQSLSYLSGAKGGQRRPSVLALRAGASTPLIFALVICRKYVEYSDVVDITSIGHNWRSRGFGCDIWTDPPGQTWEDYRHAVDELVMVLEGEVQFEIDGRVVQPTAGEELIIPAGVVHSVRNIGKTTSRWLYGYKTHPE